MFSPILPLPTPPPRSAAAAKKAPPLRVVPFPNAAMRMEPLAGSPLPECPAPAPSTRDFPSSWPSPFSVLPGPPREEIHEKVRPVPFAPIPRGIEEPQPRESNPSLGTDPTATAQAIADFTDEDLRQALSPLMEGPMGHPGFVRDYGIDPLLESMLRTTIRRSLAEHSPSSRPFQSPRALDRFLWRLNALFTSRSYDEILFEKTRRFQVDEVFAVDAATLALISHASCDPARHSSPKRVAGTVQRLTLQLRDENGNVRPTFKLPDGTTVIAREGRHVILITLVRGHSNDLVLADLEFTLVRIEDHFEDRFKPDGGPLLHALQPFLEDCLLIQAPASAA